MQTPNKFNSFSLKHFLKDKSIKKESGSVKDLKQTNLHKEKVEIKQKTK